jgi:hypothetical protein
MQISFEVILMGYALFLTDLVVMQGELLLDLYEYSDFEHHIVRFVHFEIYNEVVLLDFRHEIIGNFCYSLEAVMDGDDDILGFIDDDEVISA